MSERTELYINSKRKTEEKVADIMRQYDYHVRRKKLFDDTFTTHKCIIGIELRHNDRFVAYLYDGEVYTNSMIVGALLDLLMIQEDSKHD